MLSWSIFITTISKEELAFEQIFNLYGLRWRIEIIFKSWKSNMNFSKIHNVSHIQLQIILISRFIMILICTQFIFSPCRVKVKKHFNRHLSLLKTIHYLIKKPRMIIEIAKELRNSPNIPGDSLAKLSRYCTYEKRKNRLNFEQQMERAFCLS